MTNLFNATKPERKLVSLSIKDDEGTWIDISEFIPCFELEPPTLPEENNYEEK